MSKLKGHFFSHEGNASRTPDILRMRERFGARGYGLYWQINEYLFNSGGRAPLNPRLVSIAINEDPRAVKVFLSACIDDFQLFTSDGVDFWADWLLADIQRIINISEQRSKAANIRYGKKLTNLNHADNLTFQDGDNSGCNCIAIEETRKTNKEEKITHGEFLNVLLAPEEHAACLKKFGEARTNHAIEKLSRYKESSGKTYHSDYATLLRWCFQDSEHSNQVTNEDRFRPKQTKSIFADDDDNQERP